MICIKTFLIALVAFEHFYFLILEMFLWTKPKGIKTFGLKSKEFAEETKVLGANQGLYNGFLAVGLLWGLLAGKHGVKVYFLLCVLVAGIFGALTAKFSILYIQALPALLALIFVMLEKNSRSAEQRIYS